jgi:outer membrane protein TolC
MVKSIVSFCLVILTTSTSLSQQAKLILTQRKAAEIALQNGPKAKETVYKYDGELADKPESNIPLYLSSYDWKTTLESGYEYDKTESFSVSDARFARYQTTLSLDKSLLTGTKITAQLQRLSQQSEYFGSNNTTSNSRTLDLFSLGFEQNIWRNGFGRADRAGFRAVEYSANANQIMKVSDLQTVVLEAIREFWRAYVAQENFKEAMAARERYEKLVDSIKRKNAVGYARPGEYAQVQAELETRIQNAKRTSLTYLSEMDALLTMLNLESSTEVELKISDELMAPPQMQPLDAETSRVVRSQKLSAQSSEEKLKAAKSQTGVGISLVGRVGSSGVDPDANIAFSQMSGGSRSEYYAGIKIAYSFGSGQLSEQVKNKNLIQLLNQTKLERIRNEQINLLQLAERKVQTTYAVAQSFLKEKDFREKTVRELTATYNQGRTDINTYIDALNKYFSTKSNYLISVGDYQIALNEWAASRDELIPDPEQSKIKQ